MTRSEATGAKRRDMLKLSALSVPAVAVLAVQGGKAEAAEVPTKDLGYSKTDHVKAYLDSCRF